MSDLVNKNLNLIFKDSDQYGFYLHKLDLHESLSQISRGVLTLYSATLTDMTALKELLETSVTISITQDKTTRWFSGIITSVKHLGVAYYAENTVQSYGYKMVVESPLINLCYTRKTRSFLDKNAQEVIETILKDENNISIEYSSDITKNSEFTTAGKYYQRSESDYDFLLRIFTMFGFSYNFVHNKPTVDGEAEPTVMYISSGTSYKFVLDPEVDNSKASDFYLYCSYIPEGYLTMFTWTMADKIGVDCVKFSYMYDSVTQNKVAGDDSLVRRYEYNAPPLGDMGNSFSDTATENYLKSLSINKSSWLGETSSIYAYVGSYINLVNFYGDGDESNVINSMVRSSTINFVAPWPASLLDSSNTEPATLSIKIDCVDTETLLAFNTPVATKSQSSTVVAVESSDPEVVPVAENTTKIYQATVCDSDESIDSLNDVGSLMSDYKFYALINASSKDKEKVTVQLLMPIGGEGQGLFRVPRIGENILIISSGDADYIMIGYIPSSTVPFVKDTDSVANNYDINKITTLRHNLVGDVKSLEEEATYLPSINTDKDSNIFTEVGMYSCNDEDSLPTLLNLSSVGQVQVTANNTLDMNAKNINISCPGWTRCMDNDWNVDNGNITMSNFNNLKITAANNITFKVGDSSISITPSGVSIKAQKWGGTSGPLDSLISVDSLSGVTISGMECKVVGLFMAALLDGLSAGVVVMGGITAVSGTQLNMATSNKAVVLIQAGNIAIKMIEQMVGFGVQSSTGNKVISEINTATDAVASNAIFVVGIIGTLKKNELGSAEYLSIAVALLRLTTAAINLALKALVLSLGDAWLDTPIGDSDVTRRDAFKISAFITYAAAWGLTAVPGIMSISGSKATKISLKSKKISFDTVEIDGISVTQKSGNSVVAGTQTL